MTASLQAGLARLSRLAVRRTEKAREVVREFHGVRGQIRNHRDYADVERLCQWLFVPLTLWSVGVAGLMTHVLKKMVSGGKLDAKAKLLLSWLGAPPDQAVQYVAAAHEHLVQQGNYESLIKSQPKFEEMEQQLHRDADFNRAWNEIKAGFELEGDHGTASRAWSSPARPEVEQESDGNARRGGCRQAILEGGNVPRAQGEEVL